MIVWFDELDSTNAEALRRAEAGERGPLWIAAKRQTAGRGRRGRPWETVEGALAVTLLTPIDKPPGEAAAISFVAALAVADLARGYVDRSLVRLKWPNDVLLDGKKLCGILVEGGPGWMAIGIGVNLASSPSDLEHPAANLAEYGPAPTPRRALARLAGAFAYWQAVWDEKGVGAVLDAWRARAAGIPGPCTVRLPNETLEGEAQGLDSDGALLLRLADGQVRRITAGDVFLGGA